MTKEKVVSVDSSGTVVRKVINSADQKRGGYQSITQKKTVSVEASGAAKLKSDKEEEGNGAASVVKKKILLLGCSVDRYVVDDTCRAIGGQSIKDSLITVAPAAINEPRYCVTSQDFDIAYMFHPGANRGPYIDHFDHFNCRGCQKGETEDIIKQDAPAFANRSFHGWPDLVVVDSSLWTLSAFWVAQNSTAAMMTHQVRDSDSIERRLQQWCDKDLDELLGWAQSAFPSSRIAFRTGPTVTNQATGFGQRKEYLDFMQQCVLGKMDKYRKFLGRYDVLDFHGIVDNLIADGFCKTAPKNCTDKSKLAFRDRRHPSRAANLEFMNAVLELVGARKLSRR